MWAICILLGIIFGFILKGIVAIKNSDITREAEKLLVMADGGINEIEGLLRNMDVMIKEILDKALAERGVKMPEEKYQELFNEIKGGQVAKFQRAKKTLEKAKMKLELVL